MTYTIEKVATLIGARRYGTTDANIGFILTDSRSLCFPEETLFFALRSARNDGHHYIPELYRRGVRCFVVSTVPAAYAEQFAGANFLKVTDTLQALQRLAERHREEFDIPVVGITGSNGKTMVKEWLYQLLSPQLCVTRSPRSYNSQIGVPLSVWLIGKHTQVGVFEAGISEPGEMRALRGIIQPTISVITNLGAAHQENFASMEDKCAEKAQLFHDTQTIVYNADDPVVAGVVDRMGYKGERLCWSLCDTAAPMYVKRVEKTDTATHIIYIYEGGEEHGYTLPFIDDASVTNSIVCAAVALRLGVTFADLEARMPQLEPIAMRLEVKEGQHGCTLINDSYNSDINSLDIALDFMSRRPETRRQRRTLILSDILQSGESPRSLYSRVAQMAATRGIEKVIGVGKDIAECADFFPMEHYTFLSTSALIRSDVFENLKDEFILIKGARQFNFDKLSDLLTLKVHQTILEVNLNALVNNVRYYRHFMSPETKMVCMVKASGYGIGSLETSKTLQDCGVDYLAVAVADEGADLREAGITANIMIMNPETTSFKTLFDYRLEPEVFSFSLLDQLIRAAEKEGITNFPIHIKLDTGMHRLGFDPEKDMPQLIERLQRQTALVPCSVFSHFVGSDGDEFDEFSHKQFALFDKASRQLMEAYPHKIIRHICNSAAIEHFPEYHLDMVRLGLGLYGIDPIDNRVLHNVATLRTTILQIRDVPAGDSIGYSRKTVLDRPSRIAAIPIGYADGLNRHLGNRRGYCLVNGQKADYVGNICMDVCMIDVTDIPCREGDSVEIFGDALPVTVLSDLLGTIPYEVLTSVSNRVKRVYFQ